MVASRVSLDQRFRRAGDCPICEGGDSMKRRRGERCWGYEMREGNAVVCTQIASPHASGNGYVHVLDRPCDCGEDHSAAYHLDPLHKPSAPSQRVTRAYREHGQPDYTHQYGENLRLLRWGSGEAKKLRWIHFDRDHGWIDGQGPYSPGFYRAEEIATTDARKPVYLAGGEKCVDELVKTGAVAGCNPGGENGQWRAEWSELLRGRHVVILADADETGRTHAQKIADAIAGVAASIRIIEIEGAHDVADWLADGHTLLELLEITACMPVVQQSSPTTQDASSSETQKSHCQNCQQWADRAKIAETSLVNLRRDVARLDRVMAIDNEKVSAPTKVITYAAVRELSRVHERNDKNMMHTYRAALAKRAGVKEQAAGSQLIKADKAGLIARDMQRSFDDAALYIGEGPVLDDPAPAERIPTPERANGWGGKRVKGCPHCGSDKIVPTVYACECCGASLTPDELIDLAYEAHGETSPTTQDASSSGEGSAWPDVQGETQDTSLPLDTIVTHLAPNAQDDTLACPTCGRGGDMLKDYGDGILRCRACDEPAERR